ncbi:MAG TPA: endopeptidase La [Firmicutes bacterium]|nr:endopeptidase La [Bacillota bacterium]
MSLTGEYRHSLPLIPLNGIVVFPNMITSFPVGREKSLNALNKASREYKNKVVLSAQKKISESEPEKGNIYRVGVIASVKQTLMLPGNATHLIVEGIKRVVISEIVDDGNCLTAFYDEVSRDESETHDEITEAYMRIVSDTFSQYYKMTGNAGSHDSVANVVNATKPGNLADIICSAMTMPAEEKQKFLEMFDPVERLKNVFGKLQSEINILGLKKQIEAKVKKRMEKSQRDYYLREELKAIREELGEKDDVQDEIKKYTEMLGEKDPPERVRKVLENEIQRLARIPLTTPEANVARNYIEYVLSLPWKETTEDNRDIVKAEEILENDHYGLKDVKERIVEYLAVRMNTEETNSTILCLAGPPGVGKTSIAKSIARALNRKYVRMSLGGVRDEAEIRGHRKTYVGAMPGRIISAMRQAGTVNPLMLLDEVDKLASSYQGDPASALLEVLDSEQNGAFRDNYIEVDYDLSKVLFICTANDISSIPPALRDRMEILEISGYTAEEKKQIAIRHLIPKQLKENGLKKSQISITEPAVESIISYYCREAGVRKLERIIGKLCRIAVKEILSGNKKSIRISEKNIEKYLGKPKYRLGDAVESPQIGLVRGLAWTSVGGETLLVEVNTMKGSGKLVLTGNMGDVMKESAKVALSYIRSRASEFGINEEFYKDTDISLHIPEGAVPKDGPSAGITMTTAMVSALTNIAVRNDIAMTGEVTIRGRVLPIGGLNEKVLAAKRIGISNIIVPEANSSDISEMPEEIKNGMNFIYVKEMSQVLESALTGGF